MKAVIARPGGALENLEYGDWPDPGAERGEVVVKVAAAACNRADVWLRRGQLGPLPMIPGIDAAGTIVETGEGVSNISVGDRVLLNPATSCGTCHFCNIGEHGLCPDRKAMGQYLDGGFAQFVKMPAINAHKIRDDLSFEEAAAIPSVFFTAWQLLTHRASLRASETVLIMAAASGVGIAAVQLAKILGARVIAAAGTDAKLQRAQDWGADALVNYSREGWSVEVRNLTGGEGADVILDGVGGAFWPGYLDCIRRQGRIITFSFTSGRTPAVEIETLVRRQASIIGSAPQGSRVIVEEVMRMLNDRKIYGVIDRSFPLSETARAQEAMEGREIVGKTLVIPE